jgi:hypothetical protein
MTCHVDGPLLYTNRTPYYRRWPTQKAPKSSPPRGWTGIAFSLSAATVVACELQQSCENDAIGTCERWDISRPVWRLALSTRGPSGAPHPAARPTAPGTDSAGAESEAVLKAKLLPVGRGWGESAWALPPLLRRPQCAAAHAPRPPPAPPLDFPRCLVLWTSRSSSHRPVGSSPAAASGDESFSLEQAVSLPHWLV